eukprot:3535034-Rhodomonas_salina.1
MMYLGMYAYPDPKDNHTAAEMGTSLLWKPQIQMHHSLLCNILFVLNGIYVSSLSLNPLEADTNGASMLASEQYNNIC